MGKYHKFRVKIWNKDGSLEVQYHNELIETRKDIGITIKHIRSVVESLDGEYAKEIQVEHLGIWE